MYYSTRATTRTTRQKTTTARPMPTTSSRPSGGVTTWSAKGVSYKVGTVVLYEGEKFQCVADHVSFPGAHPGLLTWAWWQRID